MNYKLAVGLVFLVGLAGFIGSAVEAMNLATEKAVYQEQLAGCAPLLYSPSARLVDWASTSRCWVSFWPEEPTDRHSWNGLRIMVWNITDGAGAYKCDDLELMCKVNDGNQSTVMRSGDGKPYQEAEMTCRWIASDDECECVAGLAEENGCWDYRFDEEEWEECLN